MASVKATSVGALAYVSGRLFAQGIAGWFNSESYRAFLQMSIQQTRNLLFLIQEGTTIIPGKHTIFQDSQQADHRPSVAIVFAGLQSDRLPMEADEAARDP